MYQKTILLIAITWVATSCLLPAAEKVAARVNDETISVKDVDHALTFAPPPSSPLTPLQVKQRRQDVLQILIDEKLVRQFLRSSGIKIDAREIDKQLEALAVAQKAEGKSLAEYLKDLALSEEQIRDNFRMMLQLAKYTESQVSEEKLHRFFDENHSYFDKTTVRTSHIVLRLRGDSSKEEREKAFQKLQAIREEIVTGQNEFASAAKIHSQCPSATKGGDMGFISRKFQMDEAYAKAAFDLSVGAISQVVEADDGLHLIKVTERKQGKPTKFDEVVNDVRDCFEAELRVALLASLRKKARVEIVAP